MNGDLSSKPYVWLPIFELVTWTCVILKLTPHHLDLYGISVLFPFLFQPKRFLHIRQQGRPKFHVPMRAFCRKALGGCAVFWKKKNSWWLFMFSRWEIHRVKLMGLSLSYHMNPYGHLHSPTMNNHFEQIFLWVLHSFAAAHHAWHRSAM